MIEEPVSRVCSKCLHFIRKDCPVDYNPDDHECDYSPPLKKDVPFSIRAVLMCSSVVDRAIIIAKRKRRILIGKGYKSGLKKMGNELSVSRVLEITKYESFEKTVERHLRDNIDFEIIFDIDFDNIDCLNIALREYAEEGKIPKEKGKWFNSGKRDWSMFDREEK